MESYCPGKTCYDTKEDALRAVRHLKARGRTRAGKDRLEAYFCGEHGAWHFGHDLKGYAAFYNRGPK